MDELINAINRLAEAQKESNELISKQLEYLSKNQELNTKQFQLNVDNHEFNREQAKITDEHNKVSEEKNERFIKQNEQIVNNVKAYIDESIQKVINNTITLDNAIWKLERKIDTKADKIDDKQLAETVSKTIFERIKGRGIVKR